MLAWLELIVLDFSVLAPEFALLVGAVDLNSLRRTLRLTVRTGNRVDLVTA